MTDFNRTARTPAVVLVHSPLVGPLTWQPVAEELRRRGVTTVVPRLDNDADGPLYLHHAERIRRSVAAEAAGAPVVLVGHSGAGAILPAAGDSLVNDVAAYVFVDSDLPHDRKSRLDTAPPEFAERLGQLDRDGTVAPWDDWWGDDVLATLLPDEDLQERFAAELLPLPRRLFEEAIPVPAEWPDAPCAYLRMSRAYDDAAGTATRLGWHVTRIQAGHLHMLVDPAEVADAIEAIVSRLVRGGGGDTAPREVAPGSPVDPIVATRHRVARYVDLGRRIGFGALAVAIALFAVALYWDLPSLIVQLVIAALVVACLTLLPAIIMGYGIAAAEREDRERPG